MAKKKTNKNKIFVDYFAQKWRNSNPTNGNHYNRISKIINDPNFLLFDWIISSKKEKDPILRNKMVGDSFRISFSSKSLGISPRVFNDKVSAVNSLANFIWHFFDANLVADDYFKNLSTNTQIQSGIPVIGLLAKMIAGTSLFASQGEVYRIMNLAPINLKQFASWDKCQTCRDINSKKRSSIGPKSFGGITFNPLKADDNTTANKGIKKAILNSMGLNIDCTNLFVNYTACHIWDIPDDPRYYANIQNLMLVPSFLAGLTDFNSSIQEVIRYRAYELFDFWKYDNKKPKSAPSYYPNSNDWRVY